MIATPNICVSHVLSIGLGDKREQALPLGAKPETSTHWSDVPL